MPKTFSITVFTDSYDRSGSQRELTFEQLSEMCAREPRVISEAEKGLRDAFAPGWFAGADNKQVANFEGASLLCLDVDGPNHYLSDDDIEATYDWLTTKGLQFVAYTTWRRGLRVLFPLSRVIISKAEYVGLYQRIGEQMPVKPDTKAKEFGRINYLPAIQPGADPTTHAHVHFDNSTGSLLDPGAFVPTSTGSTFSGLKLSTVKVGSQARVESFKDLTAVLAVTKSKQEDLNKYVFALAKTAAARGVPAEKFGEQVAAAAVEGLQQNPNPVEDWDHAEYTIEKAIRQAYEKHAEEQTTPSDVVIPAGIEKRVEKFIKAGKLADAGRLMAPFINDKFTLDDAAAVVERAIEDLDAPVVSVPDEVEKFRTAAASVPDWRLKLTLVLTGPEAGRARKSDNNVYACLKYHPACQGLYVRNVRSTQANTYTRETPWGAPAGPMGGDTGQLAEWLLAQIGCPDVSHTQADSVLRDVFNESEEWDPLQDYVRSVHVTQPRRLDTWLHDVTGCGDTEYHRLVARKVMIGLVTMTMEPGHKLDNVMVLVGQQYAGKSQLTKTLLPDVAMWGEIVDFDKLEVAKNMARWAIAEIPEIDRWVSKKEAGAIKAFLTRTIKEDRPAFERHMQTFRRRAVLVATTNKTQFAFDETGARRYWPVHLPGNVDIAALERMRDSLWAEAYEAYCAGERPGLTREEQQTVASPKQTHLTRREVSAEGEIILSAMAYCPKGWRCPQQIPTAERNGKLTIATEQIVGGDNGTYVDWVTLVQGKQMLQREGAGNTDVRRAFESAGLVNLPKGSRRWCLPADLRAQHEQEAREVYGKKPEPARATAN